jgi:putative flavoprotein involved in K+ transport
METFETVVVGGGQAGLATSYHLKQADHEHVVLERAAYPAPVWRDQRWDSFTLVTPNWALRMPGAEYDGSDRDAFMPLDDVIAYFERYVEQFQLPVQFNTEVMSVEQQDGQGFWLRTPEKTFQATNVVIATGFEQIPKIPEFATNLSPGILQLHSSEYRNPEALPDGAVLVIGTAQSGGQIAEELYLSGRKVYLSVGGAGRAPRRYRGGDIFEWLYLHIGFFDLPADKFPAPVDKFAPPHVSGTKGGHTLNLHQFARDGVTLLGHARDASGTRMSFAPDLHELLAQADGFEAHALQMIDGFIQANGLDNPPEELPKLNDGFAQPVIEELDLNEAGIGSVIWATGYTRDYALVRLPVTDEKGWPIQERGVSPHSGLYFAGVIFAPSLKTGLLPGVGEATEYIASHITAKMAKAA